MIDGWQPVQWLFDEPISYQSDVLRCKLVLWFKNIISNTDFCSEYIVSPNFLFLKIFELCESS